MIEILLAISLMGSVAHDYFEAPEVKEVDVVKYTAVECPTIDVGTLSVAEPLEVEPPIYTLYGVLFKEEAVIDLKAYVDSNIMYEQYLIDYMKDFNKEVEKLNK